MDTLKKLNKTRQEIIFNLHLIQGICKAESGNNKLVEELKVIEDTLQKDFEEIEQALERFNKLNK